MDAQRRANVLKTLRQVFRFRKVSKTTTLAKSNPCAYVLDCSATFNDLLCRGLRKKESQSLNNYYSLSVSRFLLDGALYAIAISVLDIGVIYLWPWV